METVDLSKKLQEELNINKEKMDVKAEDEAVNILQNGILVETSKGLVCMSLNDAISSNLNLSVEDLQNVTTQLILQQSKGGITKENPLISIQSGTNSAIDSEGYTSECSESNALINNVQPTVLTLTTIQHHSVPKIVSLVPVTVSLNSNMLSINMNTVTENNISDSDTSIATNTSNSVSSSAIQIHTDTSDQKNGVSDLENPVEVVKLPVKRRGGWPKGRKRKPELLHLPPKAPATGYNLYLNEQRKLFKDSPLAFHEITKIIGNRWSSLSLEEKKPYLDKAEEEKKRYREEFRIYRQSGAYQMYLAKKRRKRAQYNAYSESDMDATDEIDDEDNEELYCRTCDQWFHNLHNKREHLQGRQHQQSVAGDMNRELGSEYDTDCVGNASSFSFSTSLDESSLDAAPCLSGDNIQSKSKCATVTDSISNLIAAIKRREIEYKRLEMNLQETQAKHTALYQQLCSLRDREAKLKNDLLVLKENEKEMEGKVVQLWQVPSWFVTTNLKL